MTNPNFDPRQLTSVSTIGPRPAKVRPWGKMLRGLAQKGMLSVMLLAQIGQIAAAMPQTDTSPTMGGDFSSVITQASQDNNRIGDAVFFNPLDHLDEVSKEMLPGNGILGAEMFSNWRDMNLDGRSIYELTVVMVLTQSPIVATNNDALTKAKAVSERTSGLFSISNQQQADAFLANNNVDKLESEGLIPGGSQLIHMREFNPGDEIMGTMEYWERLSQEVVVEDDQVFFANPDRTSQDFQSAIAKLGKAASEAGFATIKVPLPLWNDPAKISLLSEQIHNSNTQMNEIMGWEGPVMGLNGRINLTLGSPYKVAIADWSSGGSEIDVYSNMSSYTHEHFHAMERAAAYDLGYNPNDNIRVGTLSSVDLHDHSHENTTYYDMAYKIQQTDKQLVDVSPQWQVHRAGLKSVEETGKYFDSADYLNKTYERMAFAYGKYFSSEVGQQSPLYEDDHVLAPSLEEAAQMKGAFQSMLRELGQVWWQGQGMKLTYADARVGEHQQNKEPNNTVGSGEINSQAVEMAANFNGENNTIQAELTETPRRTRINVQGMLQSHQAAPTMEAKGTSRPKIP